MLEYENHMLLDLLQEDGLLIAARGLGIERVLINLLRSYSDPGNLVLVIGTTQIEEQYIISQMEDTDVSPLPKCITADCLVNERTQLYMNGGCLFITSRILVVDMLKERIPTNLITGVIVWRAHKILESCQEAFILRLYRQRNKVGFIKALSSSSLSFTVGFCHVERVMKNLFVKKLYLWPRFHIEINESLSKCKPEVIELHIQMMQSMQQIQMYILDLLSTTLQELKLSNRCLDIDELCTENAISKSFEKIVKLQLDPVWHQLSTRTKQLVADLKVLRTLLMYLCQYDCVTFYNLVSSLQTTEKAMQSAGWMLLAAADSMFTQAKLRVFGEGTSSSSNKKAKRTDGLEQKKDSSSVGEPNPETNPKWLALSEVLDEVQKEQEGSSTVERCLVVTHDDRTAQQLTEYLVEGSRKTLLRLFYRTLAPSLGLTAPPDLFRPEHSCSKDAIKKKAKGDAAHNKNSSSSSKEKEESKNTEEITLTQISQKYKCIGDADEVNRVDGEDEETVPDTEKTKSSKFGKNLLILVQSLKDQNEPYARMKLLEDIQPKYIIMYDSDLEFVRNVEVWQARRPDIICRAYFLIYKGTVEEQIYLTTIKNEKDAFEYLIKEKSSMVLPEYTDGRSDDHPDLTRDLLKDEDINTNKNDLTRKGGQVSQEPANKQVIIVDMREFRSELPSILHKRGIDIEPATIEVGDYILTPDICVERKSLSDLIGSLNSGRLYNQAVTMTRHYQKPILLIEFDHNKPFHLQGRLFLSNDSSASAKDVSAKLQLLTLHFPRLRLLWCPSPYATAELFQMLKSGKPEPSVAEAKAVTADSEADFDTEKFSPLIRDFLTKLPGVTSKNIYFILRSVSDLPQLLRMTKDDLNNLLENSKAASDLHSALHDSMKAPPPQAELGKERFRTKFGKKPLKKFR